MNDEQTYAMACLAFICAGIAFGFMVGVKSHGSAIADQCKRAGVMMADGTTFTCQVKPGNQLQVL